MTFRAFAIFIPFLLLLSCSNNSQSDNVNNDNITSIEGIIADKDDGEKILVIPNIEISDLKSKDKNELLMFAEEKNGVYFKISSEDYEKYSVKDKVLVEYDEKGDVEESNPPIRVAIRTSKLD